MWRWKKRNYYNYFNKINQKSVDFVLADKQTLETIKIIELDDRTHNWKYRKKRENLLIVYWKPLNYLFQRFKEQVVMPLKTSRSESMSYKICLFFNMLFNFLFYKSQRV